jgi:uncharacterized protein (TIGR03435 family)
VMSSWRYLPSWTRASSGRARTTWAPNGPDRKPQTVRLVPRRSKNGIEMILQASSMSMEELTNLLGYANVIGVNHIVADKTGLTARYSFTLTFAPSQEVRPAGMPTPPAAPDPEPSIFDALEDQFGLRIERKIATFNTEVVDHVERPSPN